MDANWFTDLLGLSEGGKYKSDSVESDARTGMIEAVGELGSGFVEGAKATAQDVSDLAAPFFDKNKTFNEAGMESHEYFESLAKARAEQAWAAAKQLPEAAQSYADAANSMAREVGGGCDMTKEEANTFAKGTAALAAAGLSLGKGFGPKKKTRVGSGAGGKIEPAKKVRDIKKGEKVKDLIDELAQRTYESGGAEHAIVSMKKGPRQIVKGGPGGIEFPEGVKRVMGHTHPRPTGPSPLDFDMLNATGQRHSYIYELFGGGLSRFNSR